MSQAASVAAGSVILVTQLTFFLHACYDGVLCMGKSHENPPEGPG